MKKKIALEVNLGEFRLKNVFLKIKIYGRLRDDSIVHLKNSVIDNDVRCGNISFEK